MLDVSVVIPTYNKRYELLRCLERVLAQDFPRSRMEILVCDDGSDDGTADVLRHAEKEIPGLCYLRQEGRGPAAARNLGIRNAKGRIIVFTDDDTLPRPGWLSTLVAKLEANPAASGAEGKVVPDEYPLDPLSVGPRNLEGGVFLTCNIAYRADVLRAVGGFDESFPYAACEDTDLAAMALRHGPILWEPEAVVEHPVRAVTLRSTLRGTRHWRYVLAMGLRYGYLGWEHYPARHPRLRVSLLSVVGLPLAKLRQAAGLLPERWRDAVKLGGFALTESLVALATVVPTCLFASANDLRSRRSYL